MNKNLDYINLLSKSLNNSALLKISSPLHLQFLELSKLSNLNLSNKFFGSTLPISPVLAISSVINAERFGEFSKMISLASAPISESLGKFDFTKISTSFDIPASTLSAYANFNTNHFKITENLQRSIDSVSNIITQSHEIAKINNLNHVFSSLSSQILKIAAQSNNWEIYDDYENITSKFIGFVDEIVVNVDSTVPDEVEKKFHNITELFFNFYNNYKKSATVVLKSLEIIALFMTIHQYYDFLQAKKTLATTQDIVEVKQIQNSTYNVIAKKIDRNFTELKRNNDTILKYVKEIDQKFLQNTLYTLNRKTSVKLKTRNNSLEISTLPKNYSISILKVQRLWVLINYIDPKEGIPQIGWIRKENIAIK